MRLKATHRTMRGERKKEREREREGMWREDE